MDDGNDFADSLRIDFTTGTDSTVVPVTGMNLLVIKAKSSCPRPPMQATWKSAPATVPPPRRPGVMGGTASGRHVGSDGSRSPRLIGTTPEPLRSPPVAQWTDEEVTAETIEAARLSPDALMMEIWHSRKHTGYTHKIDEIDESQAQPVPEEAGPFSQLWEERLTARRLQTKVLMIEIWIRHLRDEAHTPEELFRPRGLSPTRTRDATTQCRTPWLPPMHVSCLVPPPVLNPCAEGSRVTSIGLPQLRALKDAQQAAASAAEYAKEAREAAETAAHRACAANMLLTRVSKCVDEVLETFV